VRKLEADNLKIMSVFGPFPNSTNVKVILKMIRKIFPYSDHKIGKKPCLYSHIGRCNPCPNLIVGINDPLYKAELTKKYKKNIRNIKLVLSRKFNTVRNSLEKEMLAYSRDMAFEEAKTLRDRIKTLDYITQEKISTEKFIENPNLTEDIRSLEIKKLGELVKLDKLERIECFDIAHLSGISATASMVVLINGEKENSEYRHFKVKQKNGQSDYDSMREIVKRRLNNLSKWPRPDLIIVDGGLGQVNIFHEACKVLKIPVVGIAKHPDRLIFPDGTKIKLRAEALQIVSRIRDEAHRFARRLHHKLLKKNLLP
jgi:excinuclease ABC subunit C